MKSISLTTLLRQISDNLRMTMPDSYWVRAEISSLTVRGGHCYMELVEKAEPSQTISNNFKLFQTSSNNQILSAKVRATCWSNVWQMLRAYFAEQTGKELSVGMQVLVEVEVTFHPVYGLSLQVLQIDPSFTVGALLQQREQTLKRLQEEGVLDMQRSLTLPTLMRRIAVISSADAAGYGDFMNQLTNNEYGFRFQTTLFPALMQGDRAEQSCIDALTHIFERAAEFDAVVIIRGGGATTDMSCFDGYQLASVCAQFPLPIVAGIGHQRDTSVVDMVAAVSVKTPTAVAQYLIQRLLTQQERLDELVARLYQTADRRILHARHRLEMRQEKLAACLQRYLWRERQRLSTADRTLQLLSPETIYRKGYSLTRQNGKIVRSVHDVQITENLQIELIDGQITAEVKSSRC